MSPKPAVIATLAAAVLALWMCGFAQASSLTIFWADSYDDKQVSIEADANQLYATKLDGENVEIQPDTLLDPTGATRSALVVVTGHDELTIGINLFRCEPECRWTINFVAGQQTNSTTIAKICLSNPRPGEKLYEQYFFCRSAFTTNAAANACWPETLAALTGWFDAAYNLHRRTLSSGIGFIARDQDVEAKVLDALESCPRFEQTVRRRTGYFKGMIRNLDVAILPQVQRIEKSLQASRPYEAKAQADRLVEQLGKIQPIRDIVPAKDAAYVEGLLNRALERDGTFQLQ